MRSAGSLEPSVSPPFNSATSARMEFLTRTFSRLAFGASPSDAPVSGSEVAKEAPLPLAITTRLSVLE